MEIPQKYINHFYRPRKSCVATELSHKPLEIRQPAPLDIVTNTYELQKRLKFGYLFTIKVC